MEQSAAFSHATGQTECGGDGIDGSDISLLENSHVQTHYGTEPNGFMWGYGGDSSTVGGVYPRPNHCGQIKKTDTPVVCPAGLGRG